jgi:hypothetical protein
MNAAGHEYPKILTVEVTDRWITASFSDGRQISLPLAWSWRLERAKPGQRAKWELIGDGEGVRWPEITENRPRLAISAGAGSLSPRRLR